MSSSSSSDNSESEPSFSDAVKQALTCIGQKEVVSKAKQTEALETARKLCVDGLQQWLGPLSGLTDSCSRVVNLTMRFLFWLSTEKSDMEYQETIEELQILDMLTLIQANLLHCFFGCTMYNVFYKLNTQNFAHANATSGRPPEKYCVQTS